MKILMEGIKSFSCDVPKVMCSRDVASKQNERKIIITLSWVWQNGGGSSDDDEDEIDSLSVVVALAQDTL